MNGRFTDHLRRSLFGLAMLLAAATAVRAADPAATVMPVATPELSDPVYRGAVIGADPGTSAVNRYLQSWDVSNVFVLGASAFPQSAGKNPTGPLGATTLWAAQAIKDRYLKSPGALA